jgi:phospho-N-acetylmuramoyl-pentapeptide-transferase
MISLLVAGTFAFTLTILITPWAIRLLRRKSIGQFIQEEVEGHLHKRGTPTMGGVVIVIAVIVGYLFAHLRIWSPDGGFLFEVRPFTAEGWLALFALAGMGVIGLADDLAKVRKGHNLGLSKRWKFGGQLAIAGLFAWGAVAAEVSTELAFTRGIGFDLGPVGYFVLVLVMLTAAANAVNLTDGLDGLAAGSGAFTFGAFTLIAFWQFRNTEIYGVAGSLDLGMIAAALFGAGLGFLWWNAAPAKIFMGDAGSQALGGAMAALALLTNTHLLLIVLGGLYVMETVSVILQVAAFRLFGRRIFRMAPLHHHFELAGWPETTVIIRFWILAAIAVVVGMGLFYADFLTAEDFSGGLGL